MECPTYDAKNPERQICRGDYVTRMHETSRSQSPPPMTKQTRLRRLKTTGGAPAVSADPPAVMRKKGRFKVAAIVSVIVVVVTVVASLAYYYQPVRGTGSSSSTEIVTGNSVQFYFTPTQGIPPYRYSWTFGDGGTSTEKNPTHTYGLLGTFPVTVSVTDRAGMKCTWTTKITVRHAFVFIDQVKVSYWSLAGTDNITLSSDYYYNMWVDGVLKVNEGVHSGSYIVGLQPGTEHTIQVQIQEAPLGPSFGYMTMADDKGDITMPTSTADMHCTLWYATSEHSFMTDGRMAIFVLFPD